MFNLTKMLTQTRTAPLSNTPTRRAAKLPSPRAPSLSRERVLLLSLADPKPVPTAVATTTKTAEAFLVVAEASTATDPAAKAEDVGATQLVAAAVLPVVVVVPKPPMHKRLSQGVNDPIFFSKSLYIGISIVDWVFFTIMQNNWGVY